MNISNGMSEIVACLLVLAGLNGWSYSGILATGSRAAQETTASESTSPIPVTQNGDAGQASIRNDLVDVETPSHKLKLAEECEIRLFIHARGLTSVGIVQAQRGIDTRLYFEVPESRANVPLIYQADGSAVIRVTPLRLGEVLFVIRGEFGAFPNDSGFTKRVVLDVELPSRQPLKVFAAYGAGQNGTPRILLYLQNRGGGQTFLVLHAVYDGVKQPIPIDSNAVVYRVRTNDESSPVEIDRSTGLLTPIHLGHAIIETRFAGLKTLTCIVVDEKMSANDIDISMCKELLEPGEQLTREK